MSLRSPDKRPWRVVGRIAGPYLPDASIRIGDVTVGALPEGIQVLERVKGLKAAPVGDAYHAYYVGQGGDVDVKSRCYFWVDKIASSADLAIEAALSEDAPLLQAAFSLRSNETPYRFELLWATDYDQNHSAYAPSIKSAVWLPEEFSSMMLDTVANDYQVIKSSDTARNASRILSDAIRQDDVAGGDMSAVEGTLLTYFKVIEMIASRIPAEAPADREKEHQTILSRLQAVLASKKQTSKKLAALEKANTSLAILEGRYLSLKITSAADRLKLPDTWKRAAKELGKLRNIQLSHARSRTLGDERGIVQWRSVEEETGYTALRLAREMLRAYVDHRIKHSS